MANNADHSLWKLCLSAAGVGMRLRLGASLLFALFAAALAALSPLLLGQLVDYLAADRSGQRPALVLLAQYLLTLAASRTAGQLQTHFFITGEQAFQRRLAPEMFARLLRLPLPILLSEKAGRLAHLQAQALQGVRIVLTVFCLTLLPTLVQVIATLLVAASVFDADLWVVLAIGTCCYLAVFAWGARRIAGPAQLALAAQADAAGYMSDALTNAETVKSFASEHQLVVRHGRLLGDAERAWRTCSHRRLETGLAASAILIVVLGMAMSAGLAELRTGGLSIGSFILLNVATLQLVAPLEAAGVAARELAQGIAHLKAWRKVQTLAVDPTCAEPHADRPRTGRGPPSIRFDRVSLAYETDRPALCEASFEAPAGSVVAIVGPSGAGKSSLLRLMLRHYAPDRGQILIDGEPLTAFDIETVRGRIAVVSQDVVLFNDTLRNNLLFANPAADDAALRCAIMAARLADLIARLPNGLETMVGERGLALSGGERQRMAIARAYLKHADILLLDEPTSALDPETEAALYADLIAAGRGRTTLIVTHRMSLAARAHIICVLREGRVVECGDHRTLLCAGGTYARMWRRQRGDLHNGEAARAPGDGFGDVVD